MDDDGHGQVGGTGGGAVVGIPPAVTEETAPFWAAAAEGRLLVERCGGCGSESFPPYGICRRCHRRDPGWVEITGPGRIYSYTVNHQPWLPGMVVPFAVVLVEFDDHPGVRVVGRLRGCRPDGVAIGRQVAVGFEPGPGGVSVPSFVALDGEPDHRDGGGRGGDRTTDEDDRDQRPVDAGGTRDVGADDGGRR